MSPINEPIRLHDSSLSRVIPVPNLLGSEILLAPPPPIYWHANEHDVRGNVSHMVSGGHGERDQLNGGNTWKGGDIPPEGRISAEGR